MRQQHMVRQGGKVFQRSSMRTGVSPKKPRYDLRGDLVRIFGRALALEGTAEGKDELVSAVGILLGQVGAGSMAGNCQPRCSKA